MPDDQSLPKRSGKKPVPHRITQLFADLETAPVDPQVLAPINIPQQAQAAPAKAEPASKPPRPKRVERKVEGLPRPEFSPGEPAVAEPAIIRPAAETEPELEVAFGPEVEVWPEVELAPEAKPRPEVEIRPEATLRPHVMPPIGALAVKAGDLEEAILPATQPLTSIAEESLREGRPVAKSAQEDQPAMLAYALPHGRYSRTGQERGTTRTQEEETRPQTVQSLILEILDDDPLRTWSDDELQLVEQVTDQLSLALENARLFQSTQTALSETETLYQASAELNAARTYEDILHTLRKYTILGQADASLSLSLFNRPRGVNGGIGSADGGARGEAMGEVMEEASGSGETAEWITEVASWGVQSADRVGQRQAIQRVPVARLLSPTQPVLIEDLLNDPRLDSDFRAGSSAKSLFLAPLTVGGLWIGFIQSAFRLPARIAEQEVRRLMVLAGQAAIAIQNLRLLEESQRRASQLQTAAEIARDTSSTLALDTLLKRSVDLLCARFGYDHASIFLVDEAGTEAVVRESTGKAGEEMKRRGHKLAVGGRSVIGQVTFTGQPLVLGDVTQEEARTIHSPNPLLPKTRAELGIPLIIGERVIGALDVQSNTPNAFSDDDISVLKTLADQIAVAVDNARSYELSQTAVEEIREADRLKSQFLANMSHELRTPLNSIIGFSRVIIKGIDGPINDLQQQDLNAIYNSGQHLLGLINDVLDLSRIEAGKMEMTYEDDVNLVDIIRGVMSTTVGLVKDKPIELKQVIDPNLPLLRVDAMKVRQVLLNLLSNAAKFTEKGSIAVEAKLQDGPEGAREVIVSITDTGPGIAEEDQAKLFQPFSQVDGSLTRKTGGSGLGLSICQHLVQMHGGRIGLISQAGEGSTFYFTLPVEEPGLFADEDAGLEAFEAEVEHPADKEHPVDAHHPADVLPPAEEQPSSNIPQINLPVLEVQPKRRRLSELLRADIPPAGASPAQEGLSAEGPGELRAEAAASPALILAIDKDSQVIDAYRRYLSGRNFSVIGLTELDQAIEVARAVQPFAITLDVTMTGEIPASDESPAGGQKHAHIDGWQTLETLKTDPLTRGIPVIVCTLLAEQDKAYRLGATGYLLKPILADDLTTAIQRLGDPHSKR